MSRTGGSGLGEIPFVTGAIAGAVAFVVGYVLTVGLVILNFALLSGGSESVGSSSSDSSDLLFEFMGTVFYNTHFVEQAVTHPEFSTTTNFLSRMPNEVPELVFQAVPIVTLLVAGGLVASRLGDRLRSPAIAARAGAVVVVGYLPLAYLGTQIFEFETVYDSAFGALTLTISTPVREAVLRVGLLYPLVLGTVGALGYYLIENR